MKAGPRAEKSAETEDNLPKKRLVIQFFEALLKSYISPEIILDHISAA